MTNARLPRGTAPGGFNEGKSAIGLMVTFMLLIAAQLLAVSWGADVLTKKDTLPRIHLYQLRPYNALLETQAPDWTKPEKHGLNDLKEEAETLQMIRKQEDRKASGMDGYSNHKNDLDQNNSRARSLLNQLQSQEIKKRTQELERRGQEMINHDPSLRDPVTAVGVGAALWTGKEMLIARERDFRFSTQFEARSRSGRMTVSTDVFQSQLAFDPGNGIHMHLRQRLDFLAVTADVSYYFRRQRFNGEFARPIADHWGLIFGTGQPLDSNLIEGSARIYYQTTF